MKITPLEIRQKTFEKKIRGYDKDEVNAFLLTLSQEWENMIDSNKELKIKLETSEREVEKLREVENSLFKTLKTAEDTGANMIEQANKTAELHMRETQMTADSILNESKTKAKNMIEEAESNSRRIVEDMEHRIKELVKVYREIENQKDGLVSELRHLASDSLERLKKLDGQIQAFDFESHMKKVNQVVEMPIPNEPAPRPKPTKEPPPVAKEVPQPMEEPKKGEGSFFDEIE